MSYTIPKVKPIEGDGLIGFNEKEEKLIQAMEYGKEREKILEIKIAEAQKDKEARQGST